MNQASQKSLALSRSAQPGGGLSRVHRGFSLIEIMIVISLLAILISLSVPSYLNFVRKTHRADAIVILMDWSNRQHLWHADNPSYNLDISPSASSYYTYSISADATSFTLTATAIGGQVADKQGDTSCQAINIDQAGVVGPAGHEKCWNH